MGIFSKNSLERLTTCEHDLQMVFFEVVKHFDCVILVGHRDEKAQNAVFHEGLSKLPWPKSTHNSVPSRGVDVAPFPINWHDSERFCYFAGFVKGVALSMGVKVRWGGDWDSDTQVSDEHFRDLVHFELV